MKIGDQYILIILDIPIILEPYLNKDLLDHDIFTINPYHNIKGKIDDVNMKYFINMSFQNNVSNDFFQLLFLFQIN